TGGTADRNRSHWSTSKTPSYTKSVSWHHYQKTYDVDHKAVPPFSDTTMTVKGLASAVNGKVEFDTINDYGGTDHHEAGLK
ncbi:hypothetical protein VB267_22800, partial [Enterobacter hormaechei]|nr:hypothetical protein [Enterobacter hormaechei]